MSAPRRLSPEQIAYVKRVAAIKRRIRERLPTTEQLANRLSVSPRLIDRVSCDGYSVSSTWNNLSALDEALASILPSNGVTPDI
jgi:hypothetical protein